ncbi:hypothetical protein ACHRVZ_04980 [Flavobacterium sp. FlaQc-57]|uniref:hypothetical protein n=1 Tax=Flavobacterium sp. FlaQc-57 TaxID=3374186 RepID=UPI003757DB6C
MKRKLLLMTLLIAIVSCADMKNTSENWVGKTKNSLIKNWGPPVRYMDDGKKGEVLVYAQQIYANSGNVEGSRIAGPNYWSYSYVYVDKDGKIYSYKNEKQKSPPQQIVLNK